MAEKTGYMELVQARYALLGRIPEAQTSCRWGSTVDDERQ
jgi:hypothetical protein